MPDYTQRPKVSLSAGPPRLEIDILVATGTSFDAAMTDERNIPGGVVHDLPSDLGDALSRNSKALATWGDITPLARNEWICWIDSAKKQETRRKRIDWGCSSLSDGKRRPCCWPGCTHR